MRKILLSLFITCIFHSSFAQELFRLGSDSLTVLDKGWKYTMGDDPVYASPLFDDQSWKPIKANLDVHDSLPADAREGIGWMRLRFYVGDSARGKILALRIQQSVASEIYLNGELLKSYGVIDADPKKVSAYDPNYKPIVFPLAKDSIQVLAVRFAVQRGILYTTIFETPNALVSIESSDHESAIAFYERIFRIEHSFDFLMLGIWVMILIVYSSFYLLVPSLKANAYFSLYALCSISVCLLQLSYYLYSQEIESKMIKGNFAFFFVMLGSIFLGLTVYKYLKKKIDVQFKVTLVLFVIAIILNAGIYDVGWRAGGPIFQILTYLNLIRVSIIARKEQKTGAGILVLGSIATIALFVIFVLQGTFDNDSFLHAISIKRLFTYVLYTLSIPVAISILLARDFALTSKGLGQKLQEVKELSEKNLAMEKEKQEILSAQNQQLELQVKQRTSELSRSLEDLKSTQAQLVQSEKMASLGELTAGIAHEIQNPLNFVNNFSEVNMELSDEIMEAVKKADLDTISQLAADIKANQEKIREHGQRADGIVKSMLQHSRTSTGNKELTEINTLVDEYARLSYHGVKAKDKNFNVTFKADYDVNVGSCSIIPQDIGRVLLNLFNNAFYVVSEKNMQNIPGYEPIVNVITKKLDSEVQIRVHDNGSGIPDKLKEKIFQPFFTTKPTGEGTGLGLSLSYDIVTKGHGGRLEVKTEEGKFTEFIIHLPLE